jgi:hypothetical protein
MDRNIEQMGIQNYEYGTDGNTERVGTRNGWEHGTGGNTEQMGIRNRWEY